MFILVAGSISRFQPSLEMVFARLDESRFAGGVERWSRSHNGRCGSDLVNYRLRRRGRRAVMNVGSKAIHSGRCPWRHQNPPISARGASGSGGFSRVNLQTNTRCYDHSRRGSRRRDHAERWPTKPQMPSAAGRFRGGPGLFADKPVENRQSQR